MSPPIEKIQETAWRVLEPLKKDFAAKVDQY